MIKHRRGFTLAVGTAILVATCIPLLLNALGTPSGGVFVWAVGFLPDTIGNLMFARQAAEGSFLFADLYTSEPHTASLFNPLFLMLGWFQGVTGLSPTLALQLLRLCSGVLLLAGIYRMTTRLFNSTPERRFVFLAVMLTGGLGFLAFIFPAFGSSADIRGPEITTFFSLYHQAHFTVALALITFMAVLFISAIERCSIPHSIGAGFLYLLLISVHPYDAPIPVVAGLLWIVLRWKLNDTPIPWKPFVVFALIPLPIIVYDWHLVNSIPVFREFYQDGLVAKPWPLSDYILGWAFAIPFALVGAVRIIKSRESAWLFPLSWVMVTPILVFLPTPSARRVLEGFHLFLSLIAVRGILSLRPFASPARRSALYICLAVASLSSVYVMARDVYAAAFSRSLSRQSVQLHEGVMSIPVAGKYDRFFAGTPWMRGLIINEADRYYLPADLLKMISVLAESKHSKETVLAIHETGLFIPIYSGMKVFTGHFGETLRFRSKNAAIRALISGEMSDEARRYFLADSGISYIVWEPRMERLGKWRPAGKPWLTSKYRAGAYTLYKIAPPPPIMEYSRERLRNEFEYFTSIAEGQRNIDEGNFPGTMDSLRRALSIRENDKKAMQLVKRAAELDLKSAIH